MLIGDVTTAGPTQTLAAVMRFTSERQKLIAHNIANLSTPDFQVNDVSVQGFQEALGEAVDERRRRSGGEHGELGFSGSDEVEVRADGSYRLEPETSMGGVLFHDRNDRDPEKLMQALAENVAVYRVATDLMRAHASTMRAAITMRP